jgi:hypothetical protein
MISCKTRWPAPRTVTKWFYNRASLNGDDDMTGRQPNEPRTPEPDPNQRRKHEEDILDEALEESFPASDPLPVDPGVEKE